MRCNVRHVLLASGPGRCRYSVTQLPRLWSIVLISIALLCGGVSCGRKGPLNPLKKETPPYNLIQTG
jgi:hypothetical protein